MDAPHSDPADVARAPLDDSGRRYLILAVAVLSIALLAVGILTVRTAQELNESRELRAAGTAALKAAKIAAVDSTTYDYRTVEDDFTWAEDAGTATFRERYERIAASAQEAITSLRASAQGTVVEAAPLVKSPRRVTVLVFLDQTLTSAEAKKPTLDQLRVEMVMVKSGGRWLVDELVVRNLSQGGASGS